jgi:hypothetical protein
MPHVLHLLGSGEHEHALTMLRRQSHEPDTSVSVVLIQGAPVPDLPSRVTVYRLAENGPTAQPGHLTDSQLLDLIFSADQVISW